jgi:hypothetical protein
MQDDESHVRRADRPGTDRQFEAPLVHEVRPGAHAPPTGSGAADPLSSPAQDPAALAAEAETGVGQGAARSELSAFQRRWEEVQTLFVARSRRARRNAVARDLSEMGE